MGAEPARRHRCRCRRTQHRRIRHDGQVQRHRALPLRRQLAGRDGHRRPRGVREGRRDLRHRHRVPPDGLRRRRRRAERRVDAQEPGRTARGRRADRGDRPRRGRRDVAVRRPVAVRSVRLGGARRLRRRVPDRAGLRGLGARGRCPNPPGRQRDRAAGRRRCRHRRPAGRRHGDLGGHRRGRHRRLDAGPSSSRTASTYPSGSCGSRSSPSPPASRPATCRCSPTWSRCSTSARRSAATSCSATATCPTSRRPIRTTTSTARPRRSSTSPSTRSAPGSPASPTRRSRASYAGCYDVTPDWNPVIGATGLDGLVRRGRIQRPRLQDRARGRPTGRRPRRRRPQRRPAHSRDRLPAVPVRRERPAEDAVSVRRRRADALDRERMSDVPLLRNKSGTARDRDPQRARRGPRVRGRDRAQCPPAAAAARPHRRAKWPRAWAFRRR